MLGEGGLLRANLQGGLRSIERGESRPRDLLTKKRRAQVTKMDTWVGEGGNSFIEVLRCRNSRSNTMFIYPLCAVYVGEVLFFVYFFLDCRCSLRKHPFLLALRRWGRFARRKRPQRRRAKRNGCFRRPALFASCYLWKVRVGNSILYP